MTEQKKLKHEEIESLNTMRQAREHYEVFKYSAQANELLARLLFEGKSPDVVEELERLTYEALNDRKQAVIYREAYERARLDYSNVLWKRWQYILRSKDLELNIN